MSCANRAAHPASLGALLSRFHLDPSTKRTFAPWGKRSHLFLPFVLAVAFGARVAVSLASNDNIDVENYGRVADTVISNGISSLYTQTPGIYPYPPLWVWLEVLARQLSNFGVLNFSVAIRLPIILADVGIVYLLCKWAELASPSNAKMLALAYALNPVSLIITCLHGQFDAIPIFFSLMAIYQLTEKRNQTISALALSVGVAFKSFPVLLLLPIIATLKSARDRIRFAILAAGPIAIMLIPFVVLDPMPLLREVFSYRGAALLGFMVPLRALYVPLNGKSFPVDLTTSLISISSAAFLAVYLILIPLMQHRQFSLAKRAVAVFALFYVVYAGIAPQYLLWILPFLLLDCTATFEAIYTIVATLGLLGFYAYAVPNTIPLDFQIPLRISQIVYALSGSSWWVACSALLFAEFFWPKSRPQMMATI